MDSCSETKCQLVCLAMLSDILFTYLCIPSFAVSLSMLIPVWSFAIAADASVQLCRDRLDV